MWTFNNVDENQQCSSANIINNITSNTGSPNISFPHMSNNTNIRGISELCRVCLISCNNSGSACNNNTNNVNNPKSCGLFVTNGRSAQLWVKVMACAWVQVFEGDGLPSQICLKCHNRLDIAYQFKQQCEAADAKLRQMIGNRTNDMTRLADPEQTARYSRVAEKHPCFDVSGECLDLVQSDITALSLRPTSTEMSLPPIDFKLKESSANSMKKEPEFINNLNIFNPVNLPNDMVASFKCENFNDSDILDNLPSKLFDSVDDHIDSASDEEGNMENKLEVWNFSEREKGEQNTLQNDDILLTVSAEVTSEPQKSDMCPNLNILNDVSNEFPNQDLTQKKKCNTSETFEDSKEQCEQCGKVFKCKSYMIHHFRIHSGEKPFQCTHCNQKFSSNRSLTNHSRIHSGDRPYVCAVCGKAFIQSAGLKFHMRAHTGEKPYECDICSKRFSQQSNLLIHKQAHSEKRDFLCNVCNVAFKLYKHLQSHMKLHSEEKKFGCSICQKKFHRKSSLLGHLSIHSGEKPYKCEVCGHAFANSSNLRAHSRVHSGIKPYFCKICKKSFTQSSGLNRHMQQHPMEKTKNL